MYRECKEVEDSLDLTFKQCKKLEPIRKKYGITEEDMGKRLQEGSEHHKLGKNVKKILE